MSAADTTGPPAGVASRRVAFRALQRVREQGAWSAPAVDRELSASGLDTRDRAFAANLAYETLRWQGTLDWALGHVASRPLEQIEPAVRDVLRMGAWQLMFGRLPDRAAVGTAVDVARAEIGPRATGFVNGVLRALARRVGQLPWPPGGGDEALALRLGYPAWVVHSAREQFGEEAAPVLKAGNDAPGVTLRAVTDRDALLEELRAAGVDAEPGQLAPEAVRAPGADPGRLAAVREGRAVVQDEASIVVGRVALPAGDSPLVLDACAGPGGKSTHLAQMGARVVAIDRHPGRARLVAEQAALVAPHTSGQVAVVAADATRPPFPEASFDAVLVDAPCTGLGVVRRRPELRWRRGPTDPRRLGRLQLRLLEAVWPLVRPGGLLTYSVCTWTREETVDVVSALLGVAGEELLVKSLPEWEDGTRRRPAHGIQLDVARHGSDGMYVVSLRRREAGT